MTTTTRKTSTAKTGTTKSRTAKTKTVAGSPLSHSASHPTTTGEVNSKASTSKTAGEFYTSKRETDPDLIKANRSLDRAVRAIRESQNDKA